MARNNLNELAQVKLPRSLFLEGRYPFWVRASVATIAVKINALTTAIDKEKNVQRQNYLISQQNKLISYITGLGIAISSTDKVLMRRIKGIVKRS